MQFEFATAGRIMFGPGTAAQLPAVASEYGTRALFVTGNSVERSAAALAALSDHGVQTEVLRTNGEPEVETVVAGVVAGRHLGCEFVIAMGGGSALDAGKAVAALIPNPGEIEDYLEVVGRGRSLEIRSLPMIALPTTAGTGSEVTRNAVIFVRERRVKVSIRHSSMLPRVAIVDPELTYAAPPGVTATSGLDALVQLIEPFVSVASNPLVDALCREGLGRVGRSLKRAWADGSDQRARLDMSLAAMLSGMALANARLGAIHGLAGPIGGRFAAPHGGVCASLLPATVFVNLTALRGRSDGSKPLQKFEELARLLTGREAASADDLVSWLGDLCADLAVPMLAQYGVTSADFPDLITAARASSSMKGNPVVLEDSELWTILERSL